jgi:hypothetical protein
MKQNDSANKTTEKELLGIMNRLIIHYPVYAGGNYCVAINRVLQR